MMMSQKKQDLVAVAIDKDKGSQAALKWAVDNLLGKGKNVALLHVKQKTSSAPAPCQYSLSLSLSLSSSFSFSLF